MPPPGHADLRDVRRAKAEWRRKIAGAISAISPADRVAMEDSLVAAFPRLPGWARARSVLLYISAFPEEIRTDRILDIAVAAGRQVVLPRVDRAERRLVPGAVDWVLVPGLGFDERGYRLGRGAGYYDRLLPLLRPDCVCWALGFDCQVVPALPVEAHDIPLDGLTTPNRTIRGDGRAGPVIVARATSPDHRR
jgi:5-formyltetrahydrofolate cyclo-ligase